MIQIEVEDKTIFVKLDGQIINFFVVDENIGNVAYNIGLTLQKLGFTIKLEGIENE